MFLIFESVQIWIWYLIDMMNKSCVMYIHTRIWYVHIHTMYEIVKVHLVVGIIVTHVKRRSNCWKELFHNMSLPLQCAFHHLSLSRSAVILSSWCQLANYAAIACGSIDCVWQRFEKFKRIVCFKPTRMQHTCFFNPRSFFRTNSWNGNLELQISKEIQKKVWMWHQQGAHVPKIKRTQSSFSINLHPRSISFIWSNAHTVYGRNPKQPPGMVLKPCK